MNFDETSSEEDEHTLRQSLRTYTSIRQPQSTLAHFQETPSNEINDMQLHNKVERIR